MGKASKWFKGLLGLNKPNNNSQSNPNPNPPKKKWAFVKPSSKHQRNQHDVATFQPSDDGEKHAIEVAEAAAAVVEAAAEVVRLTSSSRRCSSGTTTTTTAARAGHAAAHVSGRGASIEIREYFAAVTIQSRFRAYLARRALRALKALVKLQALVRGHIVRKQTADMVRRMQALLRAQARARAGRFHISESPHSNTKSTQFHHPGPATPEKFEHSIRTKSTKYDQSSMLKRNCSKSNGRVVLNQDKAYMGWNWLDRRMNDSPCEQRGAFLRTGRTDDEKSDKIVEIDTTKSHFSSKYRNICQSSHLSFGSDQNSHSFTTSNVSTAHQTAPSPSSCEIQSLSPLKFARDIEETSSFCTADNSPQFYSASSKGGSSRRGPFTPTTSDGLRSCLSGYLDHPSYMATTESSKAKIRSLSAPKQRPQFERSVSTKRYSVHGFNDSRSSSQKVSGLQTSFTGKAYKGESGRLDRLGMPGKAI